MKELFLFLHSLFLLLTLSNFAYPFKGEEKDIEEKHKKSGFLFLPVIFYTPETQIATGITGIYYYRMSEKETNSYPSNINLALIYTQKKQIIFQLIPNLYIKEDTYHLTGELSYLKFPDKFYGIGRDSPEKMKENYTSQIKKLSFYLQKKVLSRLYLGIQYKFESDNIIETEKGKELEKGEILGSGGGISSGVGILINWDSRDNIFTTRKGSFYQLSLIAFSPFLGSDYSFKECNLDLRKYLPLFQSHILAFQGYLNIIRGEPPFQLLSLFGGQNIMRGYYRGRYRDKNMVAFQMEYRMPLIWRLGAVGFLGFGDVFEKIDELKINFKYSIGWGIRYLLNKKEKINLRIDFGYGENSSGMYVTINEAF
jgi:hypothetical protein